MYNFKNDDYNLKYSYAEKCALWCYNFLNGLINPHYIAGGISFQINNLDYGYSIGDIISLNLHRIIQDSNTIEDLRKMILITVIHELSHLEQDFEKYNNYKEEERLSIIEASNECNTIKEIVNISDYLNTINYTFNYSDSLILYYSNFIKSKEDFKKYLQYYYSLTDSNTKTLYYLKTQFFPENIYQRFIEDRHCVILEVKYNDFIDNEIIKLNGQYNSYQKINNILRPIWLNMKEIHSKIIYTCNNNISKISIIFPDFKKNIISRL